MAHGQTTRWSPSGKYIDGKISFTFMVKTVGLADKQKAFRQQSPVLRMTQKTADNKGAAQSCFMHVRWYVCRRRWQGSRVACWLSVLVETSSKWSLRTETDVRSVSSGVDCIISVTNSMFHGRRWLRSQRSRFGRGKGIQSGFRVKFSCLMWGVAVWNRN